MRSVAFDVDAAVAVGVGVADAAGAAFRFVAAAVACDRCADVMLPSTSDPLRSVVAAAAGTHVVDGHC